VLSEADRRKLTARFANERFDVVHVFRLFTLPIWLALPDPIASAPAQLDLDDVESVTRERIAALASSNGDVRLAHLMRGDAEEYRRSEDRDLARFQRVFVCSEEDRSRLLRSGQAAQVDVVPNVVTIPETRTQTARETNPFVFMFVGSCDHYPNLDGIVFFCKEVAPLIRQRAGGPFELRVVADGRLRYRRRVPPIPELRWAATSTDLSDAYARADAVIVPIRAGGGTRIKALEAWSFGKPVVSTSLGVEGLRVVPGEHALIGDTPAAFASRCAEIMADAARRSRLGECGFHLVKNFYGTDSLRLQLDRIGGLAPERSH